MEIDIRSDLTKEVDVIKFASSSDSCARLTSIRNDQDGFISLADDLDIVLVKASDIPNLIKALQMAVQLGWHDQPGDEY